MKRILAIVTVLVLLSPAAVFAAPRSWEPDKAHTNFYFTIDHIFAKVRGHFSDFDAKIVFDPKDPAASSFAFEVRTGSVKTAIDQRDQHLQSADFFDSSQFPAMTFVSKSVKAVGENSYEVDGTFTVKGKSYDLVLPVVYAGVRDNPMAKGQEVIGFNIGFVLDRLAYGVGDGKFYKMGVVGKDVDVLVTIEALAAKQ